MLCVPWQKSSKRWTMNLEILEYLATVVNSMTNVMGVYLKAVEQGASPADAPKSADAAEKLVLSSIYLMQKVLDQIDVESLDDGREDILEALDKINAFYGVSNTERDSEN